MVNADSIYTILVKTSYMARGAMNPRTLMEIRCSEAVSKTPELKELQNLITPDYAHCWKEIGIGLNLPYGILQIIETDYSKAKQRCTNMLAKWLQKDVNATWQKLLEVIDSPAVAKVLTPSFDSDQDESESIQIAADHLCTSYVEGRYSFSPKEWPPHQPKHYTTLALIHSEKHTSTEVISVAKELASKGKIENKSVLKYHDDDVSYQIKSISEILLNILPTGRNLIVIEGAAGMGKTVLSKEIAFQWANNTLLNNKKLIFLLFLRNPDLKNISCLEDLMAYVFKAKVINSLANYLFKTKGKDIAIILDGYDEMSEEQRQNSFIAGIINCTVLPECCLVITSRPTASAHLHDMAHCKVEILGFTERDRLDYIQHALQGNNDKIEEVTSYLQSHSMINALCYIPLNMTILLSLFEETSSQTKVPETQTDMYERFIKVTITRFLKKISNAEFSSAADFSDLPEPHKQVFYELSKLAFDALLKDQIVFTREEIIKACPHLTMKSDNWNGLGLMKAVHYGIDSVSFHFLHFSVQEYMAAYYIALLPDKEQSKLLKSTFWDIHYFNTWIMYVGITHGESFAWNHFLSGNWFQLSTRLLKSSNISKKLLHNKVKCLYLVQCFIEGGSQSIEQLAQSLFQDRTIDLSNQTLHPKDVNILGFFLLRSINKHWKKINLSRCNLRDIGCNALCKMFMDKSNREMLKVDEVDFSDNHLQFYTTNELLSIFKSWSTTDAIICNNNNAFYTTNEELEYFEEMILSFDLTNKVFQCISIGQSLFGNKATNNSISNHLSKSVHFTGMYLHECVWQDNSSLNEAFVALLKKQKLSKIHIIGKTNSFNIKGIAEAVKQAESVFINDDTLADAEAGKIGNILLRKGCISDVALVIGQNKIIGKLHTVTLNTKLSSLEIYHLFSNIKNLCSNPSLPLVNYFKLKQHFSYDMKNLYDLFILLQNNSVLMQCQISICLVECDILVAHRCKCEDITETLYHCPNLIKFMYISHCDLFKNITFNNLIDSISKHGLLVNCYILNSSLETELVKYIFSKLKRKAWEKKMFYPWQENTLQTLIHSIHPSCKITTNMLSFEEDYTDSVLIVTKDAIAGWNITCELFSLSLQLQSQVTSWKFWNCVLDFKMLQFMNSVQAAETNCLIELEFGCCSVAGDNKSTVFLKNTQCFTSLIRFNISGFIEFHKIAKDTASFLLHNRQLKELDISDLDLDEENFEILAQSLKTHSNLTKLNISNIGKMSDEDIAEILSNNIKMEELDLSGLNTKDFSSIANSMKIFLHLKKLNISNNDVTADVITEILSHNNKLEHLKLSNLSLLLEDFMTVALKINNISTLKSLDISKIDKHRYNANKPACESNYYASYHSKSDSIEAIFSQNMKLEELNFSNLCFESADFIHIATAMNNMSHLRKLDISNNDIDDNSIDAIITLLQQNANLEMLDVSDILLQKDSVIKLAKAMQKVPKLTKISIFCDEFTNDAADAIAAILPHNSNLKEIKFQQPSCSFEISENLIRLILWCKGISKKTVHAISALLSNNTTFEDFRLQVCHRTSNADDIVRVFKSMKNIRTLKSIDIFYNHDIDQATDARTLDSYFNLNTYQVNQTANAIAKVLANNKQLMTINFSKYEFVPGAAINMFDGMKHLSKLVRLNVPRIRDDDEIEVLATSYVRIPQIRDDDDETEVVTSSVQIPQIHDDDDETEVVTASSVRLPLLTANPVKHKAIQHLASVLDSNPKLQKLNVGDMYLDSKEVIVMIKGMKKLTNLIELDISQNCITNDAAKILAYVLSCNLGLQMLNLRSCLLQTEGATDIFNALRNHSCLIVLNIHGYNHIGDKTTAQCLASVLECNPKLQYLDIGELYLDSQECIVILKGMKNLTKLIEMHIAISNITNDAAKILASVLSCNISLQKLDLNHCALQTEGAIEIFNAIKNHSYLTFLDITGNEDIDYKAADGLRAVLCNNSKLKYHIPHRIKHLITPCIVKDTDDTMQ